MSLDAVREVADAVLYEGYLLYPYRASSAKNRSRWQFGVLGPPHAAAGAFAEPPGMAMQCLLAPLGPTATVTVHLRFLQLQAREVQRRDPDGGYTPVAELQVAGRADGAGPASAGAPAVAGRADGAGQTSAGAPAVAVRADGAGSTSAGAGRADGAGSASAVAPAVAGGTLLSWDEAVEHEVTLADQPLWTAADRPVQVPGGRDVEEIPDPTGARIVRRRWPLTARIRLHTAFEGRYLRLTVEVRNEHPAPVADKDAAIRASLIGAHLIVRAHRADFVSLLDPPPAAAAAAARCRQQRCWPVLAGPDGSTDLVLGAPIILYDHPKVAAQSAGPLYDATEIDEILTLRVLTMTEQEKAEARATDPRARAIVDRCDDASPADLQRLHGIVRDPAAPAGDVPWWDPAADAGVRPDSDAVVINGVRVTKGSLVRVHPSRRADAQDLFFAGRVARVTAVFTDVDGGVHVALVLLDDPAADLHDWYGRYLYFAPDELEPLAG